MLIDQIQSSSGDRRGPSGASDVASDSAQSRALCVLILRNLVVSRGLSYSQLVDAVHASFSAIADSDSSEPHAEYRLLFTSAALTLLSSIYTLSTSPSLFANRAQDSDVTTDSSEYYGDNHDHHDGGTGAAGMSPEEAEKLSYTLREATLSGPQVMRALRELLGCNYDNEPVSSAMGIECGVRQQGLLDGPISFLVTLSRASRQFTLSTDSLTMCELISKQLESSVSFTIFVSVSCGHSPIFLLF